MSAWDDAREAFDDTDEFDEPVFRVTYGEESFYGGWQAFLSWVHVYRPREIDVSASEFDNIPPR